MQVRYVGGPARVMAEIRIKPSKRARRSREGKIVYEHEPPYLPKTFADEFHPSANSLCFGLQLAHLMGARRIFAIGFTLQNGIGYHFGRINPVTRRTTFYEQERALAFCRWFEQRFPGRVLLDPSFDGPVYSCFGKADFMRDKAPPDTNLPKPVDNKQLQEVPMPVTKTDPDITSKGDE